jgi:N-acyl-D-aspartate/D-glutamate deacylase
VAPFVAINEPLVVLRHVRVIDGTGTPARDDQSIVIANRRITAVGPAASTPGPAAARVN